MPSVENDLAELQKQRDALERHRAEAQVRLEQETTALRASLAELKENYGVSTLQEANLLFIKMEEEFREELAKAAAALREAGA